MSQRKIEELKGDLDIMADHGMIAVNVGDLKDFIRKFEVYKRLAEDLSNKCSEEEI